MTEVEDLIGCNLVRVIHESDERAGTLDYGKSPEERWETGAQHFKCVNFMGERNLTIRGKSHNNEEGEKKSTRYPKYNLFIKFIIYITQINIQVTGKTPSDFRHKLADLLNINHLECKRQTYCNIKIG